MVFIEMPPQMEGEEESLGLKADTTVKVSLATLSSRATKPYQATDFMS